VPSTWPGHTEHLARSDARLAPLVARYGPARPPLQRDRFRALAESILYQQLAGSAAAAISNRVKARYDGRFPDAEQLAGARVADLRACGVSPAKAKYLIGLGKAVHGGEVDFARLARAADEEVIETLTELHGIGRWTAEMFLIFSLGRADVWPVGDYGVRKGVQLLLGQKSLPATSRMQRVAEPWRPYRSAAAWYMWKSLDGAKEPGLR